MTYDEKVLVDNLILGEISKEDFINSFTNNNKDLNTYIINLLEEAIIYKDADNIEDLLLVAFELNLFDTSWTSLLCHLLELKWHFQHENIARVLQMLKEPKSIDCLYKTALDKFDYLAYNNSTALAIKCIWALGDINTKEAREKLKLLEQNNSPVIRENATKQLNRNS